MREITDLIKQHTENCLFCIDYAELEAEGKISRQEMLNNQLNCFKKARQTMDKIIEKGIKKWQEQKDKKTK